MKPRYLKVSEVFGEGELILIEDALRKYEEKEADKLSEHGRDVFDNLMSTIVLARRWAHQFGKSQH